MDISDLQLVQRNETSLAILKFLSKRERISADTNLESFKIYLIKSGLEISRDDFYRFFKELGEAGVGMLVPYQQHSQGKFIWHYSLRDVSEQILNPTKQVDIAPLVPLEEYLLKRSPVALAHRNKGGRPKGYSPKTKKIETKVNPDMSYMFALESGEFIPLKLRDAERIASQVNSIKTKLA